MRVVECDMCGEVLQAGDDEELVALTAEHLADAHADGGMGEGEARRMVQDEAYDATDA